MENNPFGPRPYEAPNTGAEKPDKDTKKEKKKTPAAEAPAVAEKKDRAQRDLARSIDKLPLFEREEKPALKKEEVPAASEEAEVSAEQAMEEPTAEERQHIQQETARQYLAASEHADPAVAEQRELADEFLEKVADGQDPEEAFVETASEAGLSEEEIAELTAEAEPGLEIEGEPEPIEADLEEVFEDGTINTSDETEGVVDWRAASSSQSAASGGSGGATPPPPGMATPGFADEPSPHRAPTQPAPEKLDPKVDSYYQERAKAGQLLVVGLVGYLIGRRRGRIRAEKKLLPVQRKLEKQVEKLQEDITYKEKQLVAIKARQTSLEKRPIVAPAERTQPGRTETRLGMEKPVRVERLGHIVIAAEAPRKSTEQQTAEKKASIRSSFRAEQVPDMNRNDLLELSEKITIEGATLRSIYESRLIGERQLRHLVSEYLKGKDIRKALRHEMVEHEIDFERDPILRDRVRSRMTDSSGVSGGLGEMLAKAGISTNDHDTELEQRYQKAAAHQEAQQRKQQRQRIVADTALATAVVVLAVIVAILALHR